MHGQVIFITAKNKEIAMTLGKEILIRHGIIVTVDEEDTIYEDGALLIRGTGSPISEMTGNWRINILQLRL